MSPATKPCPQRLQRQQLPPPNRWAERHRLPGARRQTRACPRISRQLLPTSVLPQTQENQPSTTAASPSQHSFQLPEGQDGRGRPALPLIPARTHPDTRSEHPESYCLSETTAGIQGWITWSLFPLYTAVIPLLKQEGTGRINYSPVKLPGGARLMSRQTHTIQIRAPGLRHAASSLPTLPRASFPQGCQHRATADCWDRERLPGFGETP